MSDGIVGTFKDAWGVEDDGPDPGTLSGLLELAESWLENEENDPTQISHHFEALKNQVVGAHMERSQSLNSGEVDYDPQFRALVEKSLADMVSVEKALDKYVVGAAGEERENCWEALGELEEAAEAVKESGAAIHNFLADSPPVCMACSSIGPEPICSKCGGERLKLDPSPRPQDETKFRVSDEVSEVYQSYHDLLAGKGAMSALVNNLQSLEFTYLEAEAIGEQTLSNAAATEEIKRTAQSMLEAIQGTLQGIQMMHGVAKSRSMQELNNGWLAVLENSVRSQELLQVLNAEAQSLQ